MTAATPPHASGRRLRRALVGVLAAAAAAVTPMLAVPATAHAAGESVQVYLTTTSDSGGRNVVKGLEQQAPVGFATGTGGSGQNVTVDESTTYQQFTGGGASFTDTAAWLMNSSGALSAATRNTVMQKLFDPVNGIGLGFLRNPMGASDLARGNYTYDDMPAARATRRSRTSPSHTTWPTSSRSPSRRVSSTPTSRSWAPPGPRRRG